MHVYALQLRCGGVLEAVRISCAGYPTKMPFLDFIDHFWMLGLDSPQLDDSEFVKYILHTVLGNEGWQFGKSKVPWLQLWQNLHWQEAARQETLWRLLLPLHASMHRLKLLLTMLPPIAIYPDVKVLCCSCHSDFATF